jgi:cell division protein FtsB
MVNLVFVSRVTGQNSFMKPAKHEREKNMERHCTLLLLLLLLLLFTDSVTLLNIYLLGNLPLP